VFLCANHPGRDGQKRALVLLLSEGLVGTAQEPRAGGFDLSV
jgi:hypothetical protein